LTLSFVAFDVKGTRKSENQSLVSFNTVYPAIQPHTVAGSDRNRRTGHSRTGLAGVGIAGTTDWRNLACYRCCKSVYK